MTVIRTLTLLAFAAIASGCIDKSSRCALYDIYGICYIPKYFQAMKAQCEKTCNLCGVTSPEKPPVPVTPGPAPGTCGKSTVPQGRVINGVDAPHGAWPWQVGLYAGDEDRKFFCGGSLIHPEWVVTAAHCINARLNQKDYRIRLGDWHRFYPDGSEQVRRASKLIVHSAYNKPSLINNDIALIKLDKPALLNSHVSTVCLPSRNMNVPLGSTCFITGWGKVKHPGGSFPRLQQAQLPLVSNKECADKLAASPAAAFLSVTKQMVCAGDIRNGTEVGGCHGDSGGPFVCKDASGKFVLQGAVSWGSQSCNFNQQNKQYTVFARISEFRDWIDQNMNAN